MTVYENVYFAARLRLPPNTGLHETAERVSSVLTDVGIWHVKDTVVGRLTCACGIYRFIMSYIGKACEKHGTAMLWW